MVLFAFSLQDQVEKYGAYVGLAAFFGLAVLTLLYFAQAREVKRLREWAGRAPERAAELEQAVAEHAQEVRRTPVPAPQPVVAEPQPVAANGAVTLKPEEVAALAFARAAGVHEPHEPKPHAVPAAATAAATQVATPPSQVATPPSQVAAAAAAVATGEPAAAQALAPTTNGGGSGAPPPPPPPVTPAARRAEAAPLPPRRSVPPRRSAPPPRRESNTRAVVVTAVMGVLVLAAVAFGVTRLMGGDEEEPTGPNVVATPTPEPNAPTDKQPQAGAPTKEDVLVAVYNGIGATGLAGEFKTQLVEEGYTGDNIGTGDVPVDQRNRQTSVVMYADDSKAAADDVAAALDIRDVQPMDDATQGMITGGPKDWQVVVIVGADKSQ